MSIDVEYAIKKDIRNNPVIREVDLRQKREFGSLLLLAVLVVAMLLFSAWQHFEVMSTGYQIENLRALVDQTESYHRQLQLEEDTLRRPQAIAERAARELHMIVPTGRDVIVIQRAHAASPSRAIVADARPGR